MDENGLTDSRYGIWRENQCHLVMVQRHGLVILFRVDSSVDHSIRIPNGILTITMTHTSEVTNVNQKPGPTDMSAGVMTSPESGTSVPFRPWCSLTNEADILGDRFGELVAESVVEGTPQKHAISKEIFEEALNAIRKRPDVRSSAAPSTILRQSCT